MSDVCAIKDQGKKCSKGFLLTIKVDCRREGQDGRELIEADLNC